MPCKIDLNPSKLFDGHTLPISTAKDPNVLFYDVVLRQNNVDLIKLPITKSSSLTNFLIYDTDEKIPRELITHSNKPIVCRANNSSKIQVYIYKVVDVSTDTVGYIRRISEQSKTQDEATLSFDPKCKNSYINKGFVVHYNDDKIEPFERIISARISIDNRHSPCWFTQREFYGTSHTSCNNDIQRYDLEDIIKVYGKINKTYSSMLDMVVEFGETIRHGLVYKGDTSFSSPWVNSDYGDAMIESSKFGDCEDFAHFFMRMFRLAMWTYGVVFKSNTDMHKMWAEFSSNYVPLVYICKVLINGHSEYHSTLLLVPQDSSHPTISFEVTNPKKSIILDSEENIKEFYRWHTNSYFLVDNFFIYRVAGDPIEGITIENIKDKVENY